MELFELAAAAAKEVGAGQEPTQSPMLKQLVATLRDDVCAFDQLRAYATGKAPEQQMSALAICTALGQVIRRGGKSEVFVRPGTIVVH